MSIAAMQEKLPVAPATKRSPLRMAACCRGAERLSSRRKVAASASIEISRTQGSSACVMSIMSL
jgi:hypothetical protein